MYEIKPNLNFSSLVILERYFIGGSELAEEIDKYYHRVSSQGMGK